MPAPFKVVAFRVDLDTLAHLDALCDRTGMQRSELLRRLVNNTEINSPAFSVDVDAIAKEHLRQTTAKPLQRQRVLDMVSRAAHIKKP